MEPRPPRRGENSPEREGPSATGDVRDTPVAAHPHPATGGSQSVAQAHAREVTAEEEEGQGPTDAENAEAEAAARLNITEPEPVTERFAQIKDVKGMLQTGKFEGQNSIYVNRKEKKDLMNGIIRGAAYFCLCEDCDQKGKELSAKGFEQHALKGNGNESHNPNHHILLSSTKVSLYEACKQVKDATSAGMLEAIIQKILKIGDGDDTMVKKTDGNLYNHEKRLLAIEKKLDQMDKKMGQLEKIQSQVDTMEKNIEFLVNHVVRSQELRQELSKLIGRFAS